VNVTIEIEDILRKERERDFDIHTPLNQV